ncbi:MauE/DoxX family redox-associated membrane protein [Microtetraspora malaysiensis]|uniref:MauE/DoxX family redox-associated membrane protein n=1 Tax=Microtetraspora malaysiensis TaxID=161358 RepID=UPI003D8A9E19
MQYVEVASRLLLFTVFALALASKVASRGAWIRFVESVRSMAVVGDALVTPAAVAAVLAEAGVVVLAAIPLRQAGAAAFTLAALLLGCLTVAVVMVIRRGAAVPCRCFGASETPLSVAHVVRNLVLTAAALLGLAASAVSGSFDPVFTVIVAIFGALLGLLLTRWDDLVSLLSTT